MRKKIIETLDLTEMFADLGDGKYQRMTFKPNTVVKSITISQHGNILGTKGYLLQIERDETV